MAKAKEWAAQFETTTNLDETLAAFVAEIGTIAQARGGSPAAVEGAVREQRQKFEAVCRQTTKVMPSAWEAILKGFGLDFVKAANKYRHQATKPRGRKKGRRKQAA